MTTTLDAVKSKKQDPSAEETAAKELVVVTADATEVLLTPTENRATSARRVLGLVATLHQNSECENHGTTGT